VQNDNPKWISSLALDTDNEKIYWADRGRITSDQNKYLHLKKKKENLLF
jgi:hypothetical protein